MSEFRICTLVSGSSGNAIYAESPDGAVLIDAGVSGKKIETAMQAMGGHIDRVDALILTHDHSDHAKSAGVLARRHSIPLFMTEGTAHGIRHNLRKVTPRTFPAGSGLCAGGFHIQTLKTPHDGLDPVAMVLERNGTRCGILTDLGHPFPELAEVLPTLDAVLLESNYDPHMLHNGPYPPFLKARILADHGHIANQEAAELVATSHGERLKLVLLIHLSETNNRPQLALECMKRRLADDPVTRQIEVLVAPRHTPSPILIVRPSPPDASAKR